MRHFNPIVMLLIVASLASGFLLYLDSGHTAGDLTALNTSSGRILEIPETARVIEVPAVSPPSPDNPRASAVMDESSPLTETVSESCRAISVHVSGLKSQASNLYVAIFESASGFPESENSTTTRTVPVTDEKADFELSLHEGHPTAIAIFQDLDGNGKLTKNGFGIPVEPYGFSNNARSLMGPPAFSQAVIKVGGSIESLEIKIR